MNHKTATRRFFFGFNIRNAFAMLIEGVLDSEGLFNEINACFIVVIHAF